MVYRYYAKVWFKDVHEGRRIWYLNNCYLCDCVNTLFETKEDAAQRVQELYNKHDYPYLDGKNIECITIHRVQSYTRSKVKEYMRTILFTAGALQEFEVIKTNAPDGVIEEQLRLNTQRENDGQVVHPYDVIESKRYCLERVDCQSYSELEKIQVDKKFDWYDFYQ